MLRVGPLLSPILIGRDDLLDLADRRLAEVADGHGQLLLLAGEAGIGKSRFMEAVETKARDIGFRTAGGFLAPQDRDVPAASLLDMARSMTRLEPWADLGRQLLALAAETVAAPQPRHRVLVLTAVDLIAGALDGPTVLVFDDLQWADNLSLEILTELARATRDRPLLIVGAYRSDELAPGALLRDWRARLLTQRIAEEARLTPLTREQTALMTTLILGTGLPAPRDVVDAVYERTDGIPLHIEELLGAMAEAERIDGRAIRDAAVPDTLEDAILQRIARLSPEAQAVARAGAVIGRCFVPSVLAGIMDVPADTLDAPLRELVEQHVLEPPGLRGLYDYRHQLLRDAVYRSLPDGQRRRLHARAGEFGQALEGASEIHASLHYERAGMSSEAFRSALQGAQTAARLSSHREAFELYRRAVDHLPADLSPTDRGALLEAYASEAGAFEENEIAEQMSREARAAYLAAGQPANAARMLVGVLGLWRREIRSVAGRSGLAAALLQELETLPAGREREIARAWLSDEWTRIHLETISLDEARSTIETLRETATALGDAAQLITASAFTAMVDVLDGRVAEGLDEIWAAAHEAKEAGFEDVGLGTFREAATLAFRTMEYRRADVVLAEGIRYAEAIEQSLCWHVMSATSALVAWAGGEWGEAAATARQTIADHGSRRSVTMARWAVGYVALSQGDYQTAEAELQAALSVGEESGAIDFILPPLWGLAEAALLADCPAEAAALCQDAFARARAVGERALLVPFVVTGVRAEQAAGRPTDAEAWLAACGEHLATMPDVAQPALDHAGGLVSLAAGSTGTARHALETAIEGWDARPRTWESLWARLDLAGCRMRSGGYVEAAALLAEVRTVAERLRSRPLLARVEELGRLNRRHDAEATAWHPLTAREYEVARLIATGLTNAEIAAELSVAPRTVSAHVEHILAKLGAGRRAEIASWVATTARTTASVGRTDEPTPARLRTPPALTAVSIRH